ncbi:MAG: TetR/AcrR family transcriptional regulator [Pseudomonadota bacterium]
MGRQAGGFVGQAAPVGQGTRARILAAAAPVFLAEGYHGAAVDKLMAAAGLTRGAFYAHFDSKEALFAEVIRAAPLLAVLRARSDAAPGALRGGLKYLAHAALDPRHAATLGAGAGLAQLLTDAAKLPRARAAVTALLHDLLAECARGLPDKGPDTVRVLTSLAGAWALGGVTDDAALRAALFRGAAQDVSEALATPGRAPAPASGGNWPARCRGHQSTCEQKTGRNMRYERSGAAASI